MEYQEFKLAIIAYCEDWYWAIENGTAEYRLPDPKFVRPGGKPPYTDEDVDRIIAAIDEEITGEQTRNRGHWAAKGIDSGADFSRLAPLQRRAFVEGLALIAVDYVPSPQQEVLEPFVGEWC